MTRPALMTMPTLPEGRVGTWTSVALVERVATRARALRVGVVDGEALGVDPVGEVDGGAGQVGRPHPAAPAPAAPSPARKLAPTAPSNRPPAEERWERK